MLRFRFHYVLVVGCVLVVHILRAGSGEMGPVCPSLDFNLNFKLSGLRHSNRMIMLGSGSFLMGSSSQVAIPGDGETPIRKVEIRNPFWIDRTEVTVAEFAVFAAKLSFQTTADIFGNSFLFWLQLGGKHSVGPEPSDSFPWWWVQTLNVSWKSSALGSLDLGMNLVPVVHVSWDDAAAFCRSRGGRLPLEHEWEYACRGGLVSRDYPWGNKPLPRGVHMTNIWQGNFPWDNMSEDGHVFLAPVGSYPENAYGLFDMVGNVWEWVDHDKDDGSRKKADFKIQKGGSFLCHRNHCFRYRCGARTKASRDSTASNLGFRCAADVS